MRGIAVGVLSIVLGRHALVVITMVANMSGIQVSGGVSGSNRRSGHLVALGLMRPQLSLFSVRDGCNNIARKWPAIVSIAALGTNAVCIAAAFRPGHALKASAAPLLLEDAMRRKGGLVQQPSCPTYGQLQRCCGAGCAFAFVLGAGVVDWGRCPLSPVLVLSCGCGCGHRSARLSFLSRHMPPLS